MSWACPLSSRGFLRVSEEGGRVRESVWVGLTVSFEVGGRAQAEARELPPEAGREDTTQQGASRRTSFDSGPRDPPQTLGVHVVSLPAES